MAFAIPAPIPHILSTHLTLTHLTHTSRLSAHHHRIAPRHATNATPGSLCTLHQFSGCTKQPDVAPSATSSSTDQQQAGMPRLARLVACFGNGQFGRLGLGSQASELFPRIIPQLQGVSAVSAGGAHTAVVTEDGGLWTFGINNHGQLGHSKDHPHVEEPVEVILPDRIQAVSAGEAHTLALSSAGEVWAAGSNGDAQLGLGPDVGIKNPDFRLVQRLKGLRIAAVAAGMQHSLALSEDGRVFAWGAGQYGALGLGQKHLKWEPFPLPVMGLSKVTVKSIAAGAFHSGAVDDEGRVWVWGHGGNWQLGLGTRHHDCEPQLLRGVHNVQQLCLGFSHSMSIGKHGDVYSWGTDEYGSLGHGFMWPQLSAQRPTAVRVRLKCGAAGWKHSAGVTESGQMYTWGWGGAVGSAGFGSADLGAGQLGHGDEMDCHEPKLVQRLLMPRGRFRDLRQNIPGVDSSWQALQVSCARNHTAAMVEVSVSESELQ